MLKQIQGEKVGKREYKGDEGIIYNDTPTILKTIKYEPTYTINRKGNYN